MDKTTATSLSNTSKPETLSYLKEALTILKKYDTLRSQKQEIETTLEKPQIVEPEYVNEPEYLKMPDAPKQPELIDEASKRRTTFLFCTVLGVTMIAAFVFLDSKGQRIPLELSGVTINIGFIAGCLIILIGMIYYIFAGRKESKENAKMMSDYEIEHLNYNKECTHIQEENEKIKDAYNQKILEARTKADEINKAAQLEIDKVNAEKSLMIQKLDGSMRLLQKKYIAKFASVIPDKYANIDGLTALINLVVSEPSINSVADALDHLD